MPSNLNKQFSIRALLILIALSSVFFGFVYYLRPPAPARENGMTVVSRIGEVDLFIDNERIVGSDRPFEFFVANEELLRIAGPNSQLTTESPGFDVHEYGIRCDRVVKEDGSNPVIWFRSRIARESISNGFGNSISINGYLRPRQDTKYGDASQAIVWYVSGKEDISGKPVTSQIVTRLVGNTLVHEFSALPSIFDDIEYHCMIGVERVGFSDRRGSEFRGELTVINGHCKIELDISRLLSKVQGGQEHLFLCTHTYLKDKLNKKRIAFMSPLIRIN